MATLAETRGLTERRPDVLSGTPRAHSIDRWIFVFMAISALVLAAGGTVLLVSSLRRAGVLEGFPA